MNNAEISARDFAMTSRRQTGEPNELEHSFKLPSVSLGNAGSIRAVAKNAAGEAESSASLNVAGLVSLLNKPKSHDALASLEFSKLC